MKATKLKLLVGLVIVIGLANASSTAVANTRIVTSQAGITVNAQAIDIDSIQQRTIISNIVSNRINIGANIEQVDNIVIPNRNDIGIVPAISTISDISPIAIQPKISDADVRSVDIDNLVSIIA
jgi:hypothetical protein